MHSWIGWWNSSIVAFSLDLISFHTSHDQTDLNNVMHSSIRRTGTGNRSPSTRARFALVWTKLTLMWHRSAVWLNPNATVCLLNPVVLLFSASGQKHDYLTMFPSPLHCSMSVHETFFPLLYCRLNVISKCVLFVLPSFIDLWSATLVCFVFPPETNRPSCHLEVKRDLCFQVDQSFNNDLSYEPKFWGYAKKCVNTTLVCR